MAEVARPESEEQASEILQPDFEKAIRILQNDVRPAEEKNATSRGDLSAAWKAIEDDCHCNKAAAKTYYKLAGMSDEKRGDFLRTLYGMMKAANMGISADLVDRMGDDDAPTMPVVESNGRDGLVTLQPELTH